MQFRRFWGFGRPRTRGEVQDLFNFEGAQQPVWDQFSGPNVTNAQQRARQGPVDRQGRSLRDFDLNTRLFRYPLSFLIYSEAFAALPAPAKDYVMRRLNDILNGRDTRPEFARLTPPIRTALREILAQTVTGSR